MRLTKAQAEQAGHALLFRARAHLDNNLPDYAKADIELAKLLGVEQAQVNDKLRNTYVRMGRFPSAS